MMTHACNLNHLRAEIGGSWLKASLGKKYKILSQKKSWIQWFMSVIPASWEAQLQESPSDAIPGS
jgi:hypothetical protein